MVRFNPIWIFTGIGLLLILTGCSLLRMEPEKPPSVVDRQALYRIHDWNIQGRIAVRSKQESWHAGLNWSHNPIKDSLQIAGPFGQGAVRVAITKNFIRVTHAGGGVEESANPNKLLYSLLGIEIPLEELQYWVLGLASPKSVFDADYDSSGWLRFLKQLGWTINMIEYQRVDNWVLPRKLKISKADARLILVIDEWGING